MALNQQIYTSWVGRLKIILPVAAVIIFGLVMLVGRRVDTSLPVDFDVISLTSDGPVMLNPHIKGHNSQGEPYLVKASKARHDPDINRLIHLETISAVMDEASGRQTRLTAPTGELDQNINVLNMQRQVRDNVMTEVLMTTSDGYQLKTATLKVNFDTRIAETDRPVSGNGPAGTLQANTMRLDDETGHLKFNGDVKMRLYRNKNKSENNKDIRP